MMDFMDSLRRGVDRAGFEVDRLLRANRVRSRIGALRSEMDGDLREIGQHVMELFGRGETIPAGVQERCERVRQLQDEVAAAEVELEAINSEAAPEAEEGFVATPRIAACPKCGHSVSEGANFCPNCGANLVVTPGAPAVQPPPAAADPPA